MNFDKEMEAALIADGEKLRALTGEDHGPWDLPTWAPNGKWQVVPHDGYVSEDRGTGGLPIQIVDGQGNVVACNTTYYPTAITAEHAATIVAAVNEVAELREQLATARAEIERLQDQIVWASYEAEIRAAP